MEEEQGRISNNSNKCIAKVHYANKNEMEIENNQKNNKKWTKKNLM